MVVADRVSPEGLLVALRRERVGRVDVLVVVGGTSAEADVAPVVRRHRPRLVVDRSTSLRAGDRVAAGRLVVEIRQTRPRVDVRVLLET